MRLLLAALLAPLLTVAGPALGQDPAQSSPPPEAAQEEGRAPQGEGQAEGEGKVDTATLEELVATIEDPEARQELIDQLNALIEARSAGQEQAEGEGSLLAKLSGFFTSLSDEVSQTAVALIDQIGLLPEKMSAFGDRLQDPEQRGMILADAGKLGGILLAALAGAILVWYVTRRTRTKLGVGKARGPLTKIFRGLLVLLLDLVAPAALVAISFAGLSMVTATQSGTALALAVMSAIAFKWAAKAVLEFLFAPSAADIRALPLSDDLAQRLSRSLDRLLSLGIYGFFALEAVAATGAGPELLEPLRSLYGLLLLFTSIFVVLKYRAASKGEEAAAAPPPPGVEEPQQPPSRWRRALTSVLSLWWVVAIVYLVGIYTVWMSRIEGGFAFALEATALTAAVLAGLGVAMLAIRKLVGGVGTRAEQMLGRLPMLAQRVPRYTNALRVILDLAAFLIAAGLILDAWGIAAIEVLSSPQMRTVLGDLLNILLIVLIAAAVIDVATAFTQSYLTRTEREGRASGKVKTLIPLAQKTIKFVVVVIAGITVLSQLGMDIGPILAGVGVLGLAIGFGAQTLVKDIITGAFMLIEDAVSVGDIVSIDGTGGVVEAISIRTIRLRDLGGNVHTIPFSTVGKVTNMTKGFSRYVIECGVAYREDVDEVIEVLKEIGEEMREDSNYGPDMLEPLEIMGLDRFEDSAVVVRARLITKPGRQWTLGREFNRRMKRVFDERGIEIPFPHQTIYMGQDKEGKAPPLLVEGLTKPAETQETS